MLTLCSKTHFILSPPLSVKRGGAGGGEFMVCRAGEPMVCRAVSYISCLRRVLLDPAPRASRPGGMRARGGSMEHVHGEHDDQHADHQRGLTDGSNFPELRIRISLMRPARLGADDADEGGEHDD